MKEAVVYISMSLDGYLADIDNSVDWLSGDGSDSNNPGTYGKFFESVDVVILGSKTYKQITTELSPDEWVYKGAKTYVITRNKELKDELDKQIYFTSEKPSELIEKIREENKSDKDIWIAGGATIVSNFIDANLVDRYRITVIPTLLGNGINLFNKLGKTHDLKLVSSKEYNGMVELEYINR